MDINKIKKNTTIDDNGCWIWNKSCNSAGYGQFMENKVYWLAHRYSYACGNEVGDGLVIRHICHNKKCCNPSHLRPGTHKDNWHDSEQVHDKKSKAMRKIWRVNNVKYKTIRDASIKTGLSQSSLVKYTKDGDFDVQAYRDSCKIANVKPKV